MCLCFLKKEETLKGKSLDKTTKADEKGTLFYLPIPYKDKKALREYLETLYGLTARFMYPDVVGEAQAQRQALDIRRIILPYDQAVEQELVDCFLKTQNTEDRNTTKLEDILINYFVNTRNHNTTKLEIKLLARGLIKSQLKLFEEAIEDYDQAITLNPKHADAYFFRGRAKAKLKRFKEAIKDYNEAIRLNPKDAYAWCCRGIAKAELKRFKEAIEDYDEAIRLNPKDAAAYCNRGVAYFEQEPQDLDRAGADCEQAIQLDPDSATNHSNIGEYYLHIGKRTEALQHLKKAYQLYKEQKLPIPANVSPESINNELIRRGLADRVLTPKEMREITESPPQR